MGLFVEKRVVNNHATNEYKLNRIIFAVIFFLLLVGLAIAAEALGWVADPTRIYDFAGLVLAVVIGFIGGESSS
jgi:O-antigen/teichoic acid export membrane protein